MDASQYRLILNGLNCIIQHPIRLFLMALLVFMFGRFQYHELPTTEAPSLTSVEHMHVVWNVPAAPCSGFALEAANFIIPLSNYITQLAAPSEEQRSCGELPGSDGESTLHDVMANNLKVWPRVDVLIIHSMPTLYPSDFPYRLADGGSLKFRPRYIVGRAMTEVRNISTKWVDRLQYNVDEIWVPSMLSKDTFVYHGVDASKIFVIPESISCSLYDPDGPSLSHDNDGYRFLSVFKWEPRKGPDVLLKAFFTEFSASENVHLYLKTQLMVEDEPDTTNMNALMARVHEIARSTGRRIKDLPPVHVITQEMRIDALLKLYRSVHAYVQPTRGEGWGLPIFEAMMMGLPTIATRWGGQSEFMTENNSYPIPIDGFQAAHGHYFESWQSWAQPSLSKTRQLMRHVFENREEAARVGAKARADMLNKFCREDVVHAVIDRLDSIRIQLNEAVKKT